MATTINTPRRRRFVTVTTATLALGIASVATAAWLANGTGSGYAQADTAKDLGTTAVAATLSTDLYPGSVEGDLHITFSNPNRYPVLVQSISQATGDVVITGGLSDAESPCLDTDVTFIGSTEGWTVPAGTVAAPGTAEYTLTDTVTMAPGAGNACQGATFEIPVEFAGVSNAS